MLSFELLLILIENRYIFDKPFYLGSIIQGFIQKGTMLIKLQWPVMDLKYLEVTTDGTLIENQRAH